MKIKQTLLSIVLCLSICLAIPPLQWQGKKFVMLLG